MPAPSALTDVTELSRRSWKPGGTANLLLTFCPDDKEWWEYLDQIWDAADTAERTSLTILPALMLRAHKESTRQDINGS